MAHLSKYKLLIFLIVVMMAAASLSAQSGKTNPGISFSDFISTDSLLTDDHDYLICCVAAKAMQSFHKNNAIRILRQLNDSVFIISVNKKSDPSNNKFPCQWFKKANDNWKMSPDLLIQKNKQAILYPTSFLISVTASNFAETVSKKSIKLEKTTSANTFIANINKLAAFNELLENEDVYFIAAYNNSPKEEQQINDLDLSVNKINVLHSKWSDLNGDGITVSIKENLPDTSDIDYAARYRYNALAASSLSNHASIMATMVAGAGNSWYLGKGAAPAAKITSSNFANLLPDADDNYQQYRISVQNHSYGVGIENFYGADAAAFDSSAIINDSMLFVFSAGNSGNLSATSGSYATLPGYSNLTGSFKMAKNIVTVGAVDSFAVVAGASSRGPAFDGRIKPEMVAYGEDGSSGAAALVSGTAAILQQAYRQLNAGRSPSAALVKAALLNSAEDVGPPGIDFTSGYGNLNALKAVETITAKQYFSGSVTDSGSETFSLSIPANIHQVKITLVWQDAPAIANAYKSLVNDLDVELRLPASGQSWKPWVLNSFPDAGSLAMLPVRKRDSLNNTEQITLDNPAAGEYKIAVKGFSISTPGQSFYIAYQLDTINTFSWDFPAAMDNIFPAMQNIIRYHTNIISADARLSYSIGNSGKWVLIDSLVNTQHQYLYWNAPDTNALAVLKLQTGTQEFLSDTFNMFRKLDFKVGFNCADSVLWYWNKLPGIDNYRIFGLPGSYLQPVALVTDTQFVFNKAGLPYHQFAVAPVLSGRDGVKSYTTDYATQGVDCYVNNFTADLDNDKAHIQLQLGTSYFIKTIVVEKLKQNNFVPLQVINPLSGLNYQVTDSSLQKGINTYRARIEFLDGNVVYSYTTSVFYFAKSSIIIFPNPVLQNNIVTIQFKELQNQWVKISDVLGRIVFSRQASTTSIDIPFNFSKGIYFVTVADPETNKSSVYKVLIY